MTILELVKELDTIQKEYKRQVEDLPRNYVRGSEVFKEAQAQLKNNYEASKIAIKEQIKAQLEVIEAKAELEQKQQESLTKPTLEDIAEGYKVIEVITKTAHVLSPATLENLLLKVKDLDQLAVIYDVVNATNELDLKMVMKARLKAMDEFDADRRNTKDLVEQFKHALATSGDGMTFTMLNLASQLSETKEV